MSLSFDAIIIGGGVVGLSAALNLVDAELRNVVVLEKRVLASGGSGLGSGSVHIQRWNETDSQLITRSKAMLARLTKASNGTFQLYPVGRLTVAGDVDRLTMRSSAVSYARWALMLSNLLPNKSVRNIPA